MINQTSIQIQPEDFFNTAMDKSCEPYIIDVVHFFKQTFFERFGSTLLLIILFFLVVSFVELMCYYYMKKETYIYVQPYLLQFRFWMGCLLTAIFLYTLYF